MMKQTDKDAFLIAPCGINCGVCMAYLRKRNRCPGCREDDCKKPPSRFQCRIKNCQVFEGGKAAFCYECPEFPCITVKKLDKRYRTRYSMSPVENLENIKTNGMADFISKEKKKWQCPACGGTICVHKGYCYQCGSGK